MLIFKVYHYWYTFQVLSTFVNLAFERPFFGRLLTYSGPGPKGTVSAGPAVNPSLAKGEAVKKSPEPIKKYYN